MKIAAFTICAKNYIGLAQILEKSLNEHNPEIDFYIIVADEYDKSDSENSNVLIAKEKLAISEEQWLDMTFKYDITEFCTSIKPYCFSYIFNDLKYDRCMYFDPDILIFGNISGITDSLNTSTFVLTPHITTIETQYTGTWNERKLLYAGIYNLGFIAIKNNEISRKMLQWWEVRLKDRCFQTIMENYFTDQKWIDFLPAFFPGEVNIKNDLGLNIAPWNFHERRIVNNDEGLFVINRIENMSNYEKVKFVHFSGFDYKALLSNSFVHKNFNNYEIYTDLAILFEKYTEYIKNGNMLKYIELPYTYNYFKNGYLITNVHRKFYRRLAEDNKISVNPFDDEVSFYRLLSKIGMVNKTNTTGDKVNVSNVNNLDNKVKVINRVFKFMYIILGPSLYFTLARTLRLYSIIENHVFLVDNDYLKTPKLRN